MISANAIGHEQEIEELLHKSISTQTTTQIKAWLHHQFDPNHTFCFFQNGLLVSMLHYQLVPYTFHHETIEVAHIDQMATHPDYPQRKLFYQLLDAAYEFFQANVLMVTTTTDVPKLWSPKKFQTISNQRTYWMNSDAYHKGNPFHIHSYVSTMNLYGVYSSFMQHFDGSLVLDPEAFYTYIHYRIQSGSSLIVAKDAPNTIHGFAFYQRNDQVINVGPLMYLNSSALFDIMAYVTQLAPSIALTISENERLERLLPLHYPNESFTFMARITQPTLFSKWIGLPFHDAKQAYEQLEHPSWNLLF